MKSKKVLSLVGLLASVNLLMNASVLGADTKTCSNVQVVESSKKSDDVLEKDLVAFIQKDLPRFLDGYFEFNYKFQDNEVLISVTPKKTLMSAFIQKMSMGGSLDLLQNFKIGEKDKPVLSTGVNWNNSAKKLLNVYINFKFVNVVTKGGWFSIGKGLSEFKSMIVGWQFDGIYDKKLNTVLKDCKIEKILQDKVRDNATRS